WDVGHQAYPHKILTGRRDRIRTLRTGGGLSGFTKRTESDYDPFGAAHSSTSISAALGMAVARDLAGEKNNVIAVIGDGAMSAGMAYEAMNNAGAMNARLVVILNDNDMSIAPPVGAMSAYLSRLLSSRSYQSLRTLGQDIAQHFPTPLKQAMRRAEEYARGLVTGGTLIQEAEADSRVVAVTAAMPAGTGLNLFAKRFPDRCFDVGIAEQHAVTFAAGLAADGMKPFATIYSTFLQRAYDQVVHDVAIQGLPVRFALDRAGLVGADGATHAGSFDIGYMGQLPGMVLMAAADESELQRMVATSLMIDDAPSA